MLQAKVESLAVCEVKEWGLDDIAALNAVNAVFWGRSVENSLERLRAAGDAAVPEVLSGISNAAKGAVGAEYWWNGAGKLCGVLASIQTPLAREALLNILATDSPIVEFDQVRASAAASLAGFADNAEELIPILLKLMESPHSPRLQIQSAIEALGGEVPISPELMIEKARYMDPQEAIELLGPLQNRAAGWDKDQQRFFFYTLGGKLDAAFGHPGRADQLSRPYYAAALLADPGPDSASWGKFGGVEVDKSEAAARRLAEQYPLPDKPPVPGETGATEGFDGGSEEADLRARRRKRNWRFWN